MGNGDQRRRAGRRGTLIGSFKRQNLLQEVTIPVSVEQVLLRASTDSAFRDALLEDRSTALTEWGIELTPSERTMLLSMPRKALEVTILRLDPRKQRNSALARTVASAVVGSMIAVTATGCACGGTYPDYNEDAGSDADAAPGDGDVEG